MITKILLHIYAVAALSLVGLFVYDDLGYKHAMFGIAKAQAIAIISMFQHLIGT